VAGSSFQVGKPVTTPVGRRDLLDSSGPGPRATANTTGTASGGPGAAGLHARTPPGKGAVGTAPPSAGVGHPTHGATRLGLTATVPMKTTVFKSVPVQAPGTSSAKGGVRVFPRPPQAPGSGGAYVPAASATRAPATMCMYPSIYDEGVWPTPPSKPKGTTTCMHSGSMCGLHLFMR
jgi:hypothetical protein